MLVNNDLFFEPINILDYFKKEEHGPEMSDSELAFLCGLIKKHKPQKIVEVGVAAGGTTAVIMNCITMLHLDSQLISIDLSEYYYRDKSKQVGYLAKECKEKMNIKLNYTLYTGKLAVERLEEVGKDIDFLILDTAHSLPGEFLDFLALFPFLKQGAVVVLHDIVLNHIHKNPKQIATKLLLDTVVADKLYALDEDGNLLNIGAFIINSDTGKYIDNLFSALTITWGYYPKKEELPKYRDCYRKHYGNESLALFDIAVRLNQKSLEEQIKEEKIRKLESFVKTYHWSQNIKSKEREIYIYGCGDFGKRLYRMLDACGVRLGGYLISDGQDKGKTENVYYLSEINLDAENAIILIGVGGELQAEICDILSNKGVHDYIIPDKYIYDFL